MNTLRDWFKVDRPLSGGAYGLIGVTAFAVKYNVDRLFAQHVFGRTWVLWDYWSGANSFYLWDLHKDDARFFASMLAVAAPFVALGVVMTRRRLHTLKYPPWLVALFFVPILNLPFYAVLTLKTKSAQGTSFPYPRERGGGIGRWIPTTGFFSVLAAAGISAIVATALAGFDMLFLKSYGWVLFLFLPFMEGMGAAWLYGYHSPRSLVQSQCVAGLASLLTGAFFLSFAMEGAICIAMAAPIWLTMAGIGGWVGWEIQKDRWLQFARNVVMLIGLVAVPLLMGAEYAARPTPPVFQATTAIDIAAPPQVVWKHVVSFSELPPPTEWVFRTGLAYPMRARIDGTGVGALRHCEFSTGEFLEPIQVWDEPRLLRFSVINTPSPMEEMSLYSHIEPPHLHGYMLSRKGQFRLIALPGGGTRLEGTTWYIHSLWPAAYWQLWSNQIIHQIHRRVLKHIKTLAEKDIRHGALHG